MNTDWKPPDPEKTARARRAAMLSGLIFPGVGQLYKGQTGKGVFFILGTLGFVGYFLYSIGYGLSSYLKSLMVLGEIGPMPDDFQFPSLLRILLKGILLGGLPGACLWIYSAYDAWKKD